MPKPAHTPEAIAHIKQMLEAGYTYKEIMNEYNAYYALLWSIKHGKYDEYCSKCELKPLDQTTVIRYRFNKLRKHVGV